MAVLRRPRRAFHEDSMNKGLTWIHIMLDDIAAQGYDESMSEWEGMRGTKH
jgi:hypothetical protein